MSTEKNNGFIFLTRFSQESEAFKSLVKGSPLLYLLQIFDHKTGICPCTIQSIERACGMSRQQVRTIINRLVKDKIITIETTAGAVKGKRGFHKRSTITFNLKHEIFYKQVPSYLGESGKDNQIQDSEEFSYPTEFEEDWIIYRGINTKKVGNKKESFLKWEKSVKRYGRDKVMRGTIAYVKKCEANNTWKKNGSTWWDQKKALFLDKEFQSESSPQLALWSFKNSPVLGNILKGGACIQIVGDPYMGEALLRLKGSDQTLGQTYDRLGEKRFQDSFLRSYELSTKVSAPRNEIYSQYENKIQWECRSSVHSRNQQENRESTTG